MSRFHPRPPRKISLLVLFVASCLAGFKQYGVAHLESGMTAREHCECGAQYISDRASEQDIVQALKGGMSHLQPLLDESSRHCQ